jgi:CTD small phosphatase-like protein 2
VDNIADNFYLQPENGIEIKSWYNDLEDTALYELKEVLIKIAESRPSDIREELKKYRPILITKIGEV